MKFITPGPYPLYSPLSLPPLPPFPFSSSLLSFPFLSFLFSLPFLLFLSFFSSLPFLLFSSSFPSFLLLFSLFLFFVERHNTEKVPAKGPLWCCDKVVTRSGECVTTHFQRGFFGATRVFRKSGHAFCGPGGARRERPAAGAGARRRAACPIRYPAVSATAPTATTAWAAHKGRAARKAHPPSCLAV